MPLLDVPLGLLLEVCAPRVSPVTMAAIVQQESGGDALAIHDNRTAKTVKPKSLEEAIRLAQVLMKAGDSVDLGLAQINNANLQGLKLNVASAFEPCSNLQAAQALLLDAWIRSRRNLSATLAAYHTGCLRRCSPESVELGAAYSALIYARAGEGLSQKHPARPATDPNRESHLAIASPLTPQHGDLTPKTRAGMSP